MYRLDMSTYNISTWTHNTVYIYILERERDCVVYSHSFPNLPQEYRPTELLLDLLKSFTKALQWFTPTSVGVRDPSFQTRLPTITPQTICVRSVMSSLISSARWSQRSCSYPSYPDHGHPTPLPGNRPLLDWSHWRSASQKPRPITSLWYT